MGNNSILQMQVSYLQKSKNNLKCVRKYFVFYWIQQTLFISSNDYSAKFQIKINRENKVLPESFKPCG